MKKLVCLALVFLLAIGGLAACGNTPAQESTPPADEPATPPASEDAGGEEAPAEGGEGPAGEITVASWNVGADALSEIAEAYMAQNPNATITVEYVDGQYEKLRPALAAGSGVPDVFSTQKADFPAFMNKYGDVFADVSDILAPEVDNFVADAISQVEKDGKYYAFPWDIGPCGMFYHKATFEEAGVDPASLTTWDKFTEAGKTIMEKTGRYMWATNLNGSTGIDEPRMLFQQLAGAFYAEDGSVQLNTPEMVKAFETMLSMEEAGIIADIPDAWNDRIKLMVEDKLAAVPYAVWFAGTMSTAVENGAGEWGIMPIPAFEEGGNIAVGLGGSVNAIYKDSPNVELAKDYLKFASMSETGGAINLKYGLFSAYKPNHTIAAYGEVDEYFGVALGDTFAPWADAPFVDHGPYFTDVLAAMQTAAGEIQLNGKDIGAALDEATQQAQRAIDADA